MIRWFLNRWFPRPSRWRLEIVYPDQGKMVIFESDCQHVARERLVMLGCLEVMKGTLRVTEEKQIW